MVGPVGGWRSATSPLNVASTSSVLPVPGYGAYGQVTARQPAVPSVARRSVPDSGTPRTCMPGAGCYRPLYASSACVAGGPATDVGP